MKESSVRDGVPGRVCSTCNEWTPMTQMTRGRICGKCKRKQPKQVFTVSRSKAKFRGDSWLLTYEEFFQFWGKPCYYCGDPFDVVRLDRIDPTGAYELGNVVSCCWACNRGKGAGTQAEFLARCRAVASKLSSPSSGVV